MRLEDLTLRDINMLKAVYILTKGIPEVSVSLDKVNRYIDLHTSEQINMEYQKVRMGSIN
jgi:hypothetical protein